MNVVALLDLLRSNKSQDEFASELGVSQSHISMIYQGKRGLNKKLFVALMAHYPQQKDRILEVFLLSNNLNRETYYSKSNMPTSATNQEL